MAIASRPSNSDVWPPPVDFTEVNGNTRVTIQFDAEDQNFADLQQQGWQAILNNFIRYTEST